MPWFWLELSRYIQCYSCWRCPLICFQIFPNEMTKLCCQTPQRCRLTLGQHNNGILELPTQSQGGEQITMGNTEKYTWNHFHIQSKWGKIITKNLFLCVYFNMSSNILQNLWSKTLLKDTPVSNRKQNRNFIAIHKKQQI